MSLVELTVATLIISILVAIALSTFQRQADKAKDTDVKARPISLEHTVKVRWASSNNQTLPTQAQLVSSPASSQPSANGVSGAALTPGAINGIRGSSDSVTLREVSASGEDFAVRSSTASAGADTYRIRGGTATSTVNSLWQPKLRSRGE